jgi:hypothetical protein
MYTDFVKCFQIQGLRLNFTHAHSAFCFGVSFAHNKIMLCVIDLHLLLNRYNLRLNLDQQQRLYNHPCNDCILLRLLECCLVAFRYQVLGIGS